MASLLDMSVFTIANLYQRCLACKADSGFSAGLCNAESLLLTVEDDIIAGYIGKSLPHLCENLIPDYVSILLESQLLHTIKETNCTAEHIKALVICKHLLLDGLYAENLEYFMAIAAEACSANRKSALFAMFDAYNNLATNRYQQQLVAPQDKIMPANFKIVSHTVNNLESK